MTDAEKFPPLPRGPHHLGPEQVAASQRARMLDAMARSVATRGYAETTVADVVRLAGVSRKTFYQQFANKEDCYRAAFDHAAHRVTAALNEESWRAAGTERKRIERLYASLTAALAGMPDYTRAFVAAAPQPVDEVLACQERWRATSMRALGEIYSATARAPAELPHAVARAAVGATDSLILEHIATRGPETLGSLTPILSAVANALLDAAGTITSSSSTGD
ncbi:TetR/AcrR family transcriptional regulator [Tsukamurella sp. NPDC003166]|uniref:TetR/AcrR family transcriptional regulator n=1 Tax=Tsukamurella sp. NPDC003166 TaxID=3154444 RepID=UPI0033A04B0F